MSRVLLINPASDHRIEENGRTVDPFAFYPPLQLAYLAAVLSQRGHEVAIEDMGITLPTRDELQARLLAFEPQVIGLTCYAITYKNALKLTQVIRNLLPKALIVMGGPHVSFTINETLAEPSVDVVVRYEGEMTFLELVECHAAGGDLAKVAGISFCRGNELIETPLRSNIPNLDDLPMPAWHLLPMERYKYPGVLITSRGCVASCIFCVSNAIYKASTRQHTAERVVQEIHRLEQICGPLRSLDFIDDDFLRDRDKIFRLCQYIVEKFPHLRWVCTARVDTIDARLMQAIASAGCRRIEFGVESGSPMVLARLGKKIGLDQVEKVIQLAVENGVNTAASFIIGHPQDTLKTVSESIVFAHHLRQMGRPSARVFTPFHILVPYPGTPIERHAERLGIQIHSRDYSQYTPDRAVISTQHLPAGKLNAIYAYAMRAYNLPAPIPQKVGVSTTGIYQGS